MARHKRHKNAQFLRWRRGFRDDVEVFRNDVQIFSLSDFRAEERHLIMMIDMQIGSK